MIWISLLLRYEDSILKSIEAGMPNVDMMQQFYLFLQVPISSAPFGYVDLFPEPDYTDKQTNLQEYSQRSQYGTVTR